MSYERRVKQVVVSPEGDLNSEKAFVVSIEDLGCGEFIQVAGFLFGGNVGTLHINPEEWYDLREAIDQLVCGCKEYKADE